MADEKSNVEQATERGSLVIPSGDLGRPGAMTASMDGFKQAWQMANYYAKSSLIPSHYQGKPENVLIAVTRANRLGVDPLFLMEASYIIGGKLAFEGKFVIALLNGCKRFSPLRWEEGTDKDGDWAICYATDLVTGEVLKSIKITMAMAKAEDWLKNKKWQSMPQQMLRYRSAAFFARTYAADILGGVMVEGEPEEITNGRTEKVVALNNEVYGEEQPPAEAPEHQEPPLDAEYREEKNPEPAAQPPAEPETEDGWPETPPEEGAETPINAFKGNPDVATQPSQQSIFRQPRQFE